MINQIKKTIPYFQYTTTIFKALSSQKIINQDRKYQDKYLYNHFQFIY